MSSFTQSSSPLQQVSELAGPMEAQAKVRKHLGFRFALDKRFLIEDIVGTGAYGVVASAKDLQSNSKVAVKKLEGAFEHRLLTKRLLRELKVMRLLSHENLLSIKSIQLPVSKTHMTDLYIVMELMETDLGSVIRSTQPLTDMHSSFFLYQLLRGLKYMKDARIVHRDLKPRNVLVNSDCQLKIGDFGLARTCHEHVTSSAKMTDYVASRWYRAPELLLKFHKHSFAIDMWSVGCILAEMLLRRPLLPGTSSGCQVKLILNMLGRPSEEDLSLVPDLAVRRTIGKYPVKPAYSLEEQLKEVNPQAVDLLKKMLAFNPSDRITVEQALRHPYVNYLHSPEDDNSVPPLNAYDFGFEKRQLNLKILRELVYDEILLYHSKQRLEEYESDRRTYEECIAGLPTI